MFNIDTIGCWDERILMNFLTFACISLACIMIISSIIILVVKRFVVILIALGIGSVSLAIILGILGAPYASSFELSVGVGLVGVLLIIATSLTKEGKAEDDQT